MGIYNNGKEKVSASLENKNCPFCNSRIAEVNLEGHLIADSYEYLCKNCNPKTIVSLSGDVAIQIDNLVNLHKHQVAKIKAKIKNSQALVTHISEGDFF